MKYYEHVQSYHQLQIATVYWLKSEKTQKCSRSHRASKVCSQLLLDGFCSFRSCKGEQSDKLQHPVEMRCDDMWRLGLGTQTCQVLSLQVSSNSRWKASSNTWPKVSFELWSWNSSLRCPEPQRPLLKWSQKKSKSVYIYIIYAYISMMNTIYIINYIYIYVLYTYIYIILMQYDAILQDALLLSNTLDMFLHRPGQLAASATPDPCHSVWRHEGGTLKLSHVSHCFRMLNA